MQKLIDYIEQYVKLDEDAVAGLYKYAEIDKFQKNEYILEAGQRCNRLWFLKKGMVRKFHYHQGNEVTSWIHTENEIFTSLESYSRQSPTDEYLQACEYTEVISISKTNSEKLVQHPQILLFINHMMEKEFVKLDINTREFNQKDAKGKYEYLKQIAPEMIKRAKLGHIASIMGVTQETLSRVRRG